MTNAPCPAIWFENEFVFYQSWYYSTGIWMDVLGVLPTPALTVCQSAHEQIDALR